MKKIIGITPNMTDDCFTINKTYINAILASDCIPFLITYNDTKIIDFILDKIDALVISGGGDINPVYFSEELHEKASLVSPIRDEFELLITKKIIETKKPFLGICRGAQVLNVALNGTINQHIEGHSFLNERNNAFQDLEIKKDTLLYDILKKDTIKVNSIHHQCVNELGENLIASSYSKDKIIESIELPSSKFTIGLQWHPEAIFGLKEQQDIFKYFANSI